MKVWVVFGTRPEAIKMAPVVHALQKTPGITPIVVSTGQHQELLLPVLEHFDIKPDLTFTAMKSGQNLNQLSQRVLGFIDEELNRDTPDYVLVHGDTTTSAMAAIAAFHCRVPVGHVEAGLRTGDMTAPFPEEMNRSLVGRIAQLHFAPTTSSSQNLLRENVKQSTIHVTGNTVIDALYFTRDWMEKTGWTPDIDALRSLDPEKRTVLITGHRRENFGDGFANICAAIKQLAEKFSDWQFVYPVHLNPNVQEPVNRILRGLNNVHLIDPLGYRPFIWLMQFSDIILTDSGGIQEEGPAIGKPVLVMREVTERPEAVEAGTVALVGNSTAGIVNKACQLMSDASLRDSMGRQISPYGDGTASQQIADILKLL